jgi:hypothetical protein
LAIGDGGEQVEQGQTLAAGGGKEGIGERGHWVYRELATNLPRCYTLAPREHGDI